MPRSLLAAAKPVLIAAVVAFLAAELADTANMLQLSTLHAAALAALAAALRAVYATLAPAQRGVKAAGARARRAFTKPAADAAGITGRRQMHIAIDLDVAAAKVTHDDLASWLPALDKQVTAFCRAWGLLKPRVTLYSGNPHGVDLIVTVLDNSDQAEALGYHDETPDGVPYARVFALDCEQANVSVSSCVSHELLEAIADLACDRWAQAGDGRLWAVEVCDPVEADTYTVDGVEVSSYVLPAFFDPNGHAPYDALNRLDKPFALSTGGYGIVMDGGQVRQIYGSRKHYDTHEAWRKKTKKTPLSRTARRLAASH